ncbi:MAG TPA: DUF2163 domain-containing protein [Caulobacteraceae bacterium]|jgi:uncharacterized phage protein (TIGR02218 family)
MRFIPGEFAARLDGGAANLCTCWIVTRADGARMGFTDHDRPLEVDGVSCAAASGWTAGAAEAELGFAAGTASAEGVLDGEAISERDIAAGLFDGAEVEAWRVDWGEPSLKVMLWSGTVARLVREGQRFTAEVEGPLARLERVAGRTYGRLCDAILGDGRCRKDVSVAAFNGAGVVLAVEDNRRLVVSGLEDFAAGWFARGRLVFTGGENAGGSAQVAAHDVGAAGVVLVLQERPAFAVAAGDGFEVRAGCDKRWGTCGAKFANTINFQGFPHIPGDDFLLARAAEGEVNDGGSRVGAA